MSFQLSWVIYSVPALVASLLGCSAPDEHVEGDEPVETSTDALVTQQVDYQAGGFTATTSLISNFDGGGNWPDGRNNNTIRLAACNAFNRLDGTPGAQLYVAAIPPSGTPRLYVTNDAARDYVAGNPNVSAGTTWAEIPSGLAIPQTGQIGCDGHRLFALNSANQLYAAGTWGNGNSQTRRGDGTFDWWFLQGTNPLFSDLQSGAGNLYVVGPGTNKTLYSQDSTLNGVWVTHSTLPQNFVRVTGAGKASMAKLASTPGNKMSGKNPPNRAFAIKTDGRLEYNDGLLSDPSSNTWTPLSFGAATFEDISASAPDVLWAITFSGGMRHLHQIRFTENDCSDKLDNDADGLTDGEDPECMTLLAQAYCLTAANGTHCANRFTNSSDYLVRCSNNTLVGSPDPGRCRRVTSGWWTGRDRKINTNIPEPSGMGRWCSGVYRPSGGWYLVTEGFAGVTNRDPCAFIQAQQPAGQTTEITGAGLYSLSGVNNVVGFCDNGAGAGRVYANRRFGTAPIDDIAAYLAGNPGCKFLVSPGDLPILDLPWDQNAVAALNTAVGYGGVFVPPSVPQNHPAWDFMLPEGIPVLAVANGEVVGFASDLSGNLYGGSMDAVAEPGALGDSHQSGIMIQHDVQRGSRYQESFVSVYAHMRQRLVVPGQEVEKGQVIGYVGQLGQTWGSHIHFGIVRLSNTVLSATDSDLSSTLVHYDPWPIRKEVTSTSIISPFGWRGGVTTQDPWGTAFVLEGRGAFSPDMWNPGQTPSPLPVITDGY